MRPPSHRSRKGDHFPALREMNHLREEFSQQNPLLSEELRGLGSSSARSRPASARSHGSRSGSRPSTARSYKENRSLHDGVYNDLRASLDKLSAMWTKEEKLIKKATHPAGSSRSRRNSVCLSARSQRAASPTGIDRGRPVAVPLTDLFTPRGVLMSRVPAASLASEMVPRLPISSSVPAYSNSPRRGDLTTERSDLISDRPDSRRPNRLDEAATAAQAVAMAAREKATAEEGRVREMQHERHQRSRSQAMEDMMRSPSFAEVERQMLVESQSEMFHSLRQGGTHTRAHTTQGHNKPVHRLRRTLSPPRSEG